MGTLVVKVEIDMSSERWQRLCAFAQSQGVGVDVAVTYALQDVLDKLCE